MGRLLRKGRPEEDGAALKCCAGERGKEREKR